MPEFAPRQGHERSNGEAERTVQAVQGLARTLKDSLEQESGMQLDERSPVLAWLVEHAGNLLTLLRKGADGHTALYRLRCKPWKRAVLQFGECIDFRQKTPSKMHDKYRPGVFLGLKLDSTELIVADKDGVYLISDYLRVCKNTSLMQTC